MENDGNVEQDQVVKISVLTPAAEEPVTRQYEGSVAPLRLARLAADASDGDAIAWVATAEHLAALLNVQAEQALICLMKGTAFCHSLMSFYHLYQALGEELGDVAIAMYTSYLPVSLHIVVFSLGPDAILDTAMQVVAANIEAVRQAEVSGSAMKIDALGFGAFVPKYVTKCTVFAVNGKLASAPDAANQYHKYYHD
ncbi:hypothetical protein COEREDRAFT_10447 [Coemansia reversa NRRL 1564]|uniref:Uncharacterized protein n=1 Tax=Coemansia reversa (strain ATCC 12441 / NRRL 1564) TaxID=763665 RepID=A0A2G5B5W9_COERN|nr:hypothetical protein COEREDRAFT_10447 [Coemansia reversa NRRL 1564]|eukprot:PIA14394.1 hypothetical protein COEREDRAFT_10447 [Coemansia reversa NRRL 1564]